MESSNSLISLDTALSQMLSRISPLTESETLPLVACFGRVVAQDIISPVQSGNALPVAGKAFAGQPFDGEWPAGTCIRIMTGAPIPAGCDAVVMQEQTEQTDAGICFTAEVRANQNIRRAG